MTSLLHWSWPVAPSTLKVFGAKMFFEHFANFGESNEFIEELLEPIFLPMSETKLLILFRSSLLETYVSLMIAFETSRWYELKQLRKYNGDKGIVSNDVGSSSCVIKIDLNHFLSWAKREVLRWQKLMTLVRRSGFPFLVIEYNEVGSDDIRRATMNRVFSFLGVHGDLPEIEIACSSPMLEKQSIRPLSAQVSNFNELKLDDIERDPRYKITTEFLRASFYLVDPR